MAQAFRTTPRPFRVLVIGGYGFFGRRLTQHLSQQPGLDITIAGRSAQSGQALCRQLQATALSPVHFEQLDAMASGLDRELQRIRPNAVIHTSGPFQGQDYRVAQACIAARAHYIDLADGCTFVAGIGTLDAAALAHGLLVTSGASSVPALSSAVVDQLAHGMATLSHIDIGISPGNKTERGIATVRAILGYCGQPIAGTLNGPPDIAAAATATASCAATKTAAPSAKSASAVIGWGRNWHHTYPAPIGERWLAPCEVPDVTLLGPRYPGRPAVRFGAGLELGVLQYGMNAMAWMVQRGWVANWATHAKWLKGSSDLLRFLGSTAGAMHVDISGCPTDGALQRRSWHLIATQGDGPFVPTLAAAALVRQLATGTLTQRGALPCMGLLSLQDILYEAEGLAIVTEQNHANAMA